MRSIFFLFFSSLLLVQFNAAAAEKKPSFDCTKASTPAEKLICSDESFSAIDAELGSVFKKAKAEHPEAVGYLEKSQIKWLKNRDNQCPINLKNEDKSSDINCLIFVYKTRLNILATPVLWPPFTEAKALSFLAKPPEEGIIENAEGDNAEEIACWASVHRPQEAVRVFIEQYANFGRFSTICDKEGIRQKLSEVDALWKEYDKVSGNDTKCRGSISRDVAHNNDVLYWRAAIDSHPARPEEINKASKKFPRSLEHWAEQGLWQKEQYKLIVALRNSALKALEKY